MRIVPDLRTIRSSIAIVGAVAVATTVPSACSSTPDATASTPSPTSTTLATAAASTTSTSPPSTSTTAASTTSTSPSPTSTTSTSTTSTSTTSTSTTVVPTPSVDATVPPSPVLDAADALAFPTDTEIEIGRSVEGRPITVIRRGDPAGARVLVVGAIHGNEDAGVAIVDRLATEPLPDGVELWLVRSMNPDGQAHQVRQNARDVDLNRNFPENWGLLGEPGDWQYAGTGPASEPETQTMVALGGALRPDLILWYHQDLFRISPGSGRSGEIRTRYAAIAGLPIVEITGGTYTGTAAQWARTVLPPDVGVGITVELGPTLSDTEVTDHVAAALAIATEFF